MSAWSTLSVAATLSAMLETKEGEQALRDLWDTLDADGDGKVSGKEWGSKVYQEQELMSKYFGGSSMAEIGAGFNRIDDNGDDQLTWDEFKSEVKSYKALIQLKETLSSEEGKAALKKLWEKIDANGDSKVTGKEWGSKVYQEQELMSKYFGGSDLPSIGKGFNRLDKDGDGSLTWGEFTSAAGEYIL
eukprot:CAMPEP_0172328274 /NCGR_PEP_ID=MMETSP1058-20130122/60267_1 /TAXON_ID=83371 /ORGANISM="Detonula confervacea, Strain CCMP 353" /LENGTH=187 /DNA_ID=CAMNT_0013045383 /DNA_START=997 /DNA_END=1560 /DNA_ORIENTATION=+